ncbi:Recombinase [Pirellula sp. SH-Sr6A]|uniref:recombinase family protein n=1 Tax=Pirellula sp. SH-Sr6A TaxID=1632865 RepID=UPI00078D6C26|nr:recombinase family protein [Pirellula sp. SH-Sr6A]AMV32081.1 Recombinase [Pirellula sp. SH-Sr6A]
MNNWWEVPDDLSDKDTGHIKAVAYYRHSAQDRQENSIPIQQDQVRDWAKNHGVEIIEEFADHGRSGLTSEGRPAFTDMMENWVKKRNDFQYILCLDVSRWGRFQDIDLSAQFSAECKKAGKQVIYTTIGKPREDDPLYPVYVQFERFRAAQYSKELSDKVWRGCVKISEQGYWAGGPPPYGLDRLLLDESKHPLHPLAPGQRKSIQNQRVTLTPSASDEARIVARIFDDFVNQGHSERQIAKALNREGILSPGGMGWSKSSVKSILQNEKYVGTIVYNRTTQKLKTPRRENPEEKWVRTPGAFDGIIESELFLKAQEIFQRRRDKYESENMLAGLQKVFENNDFLRPSLMRAAELPSAACYGQKFGSLDFAFQQLFTPLRNEARRDVEAKLQTVLGEVLSYADFLVLDRKLTLSLQPVVPTPHGYAAYWPLRRDSRAVIDLTLGVLLAEPAQLRILGYIALPKWIQTDRSFRVFCSSQNIELLGHRNLDFLTNLVQ